MKTNRNVIVIVVFCQMYKSIFERGYRMNTNFTVEKDSFLIRLAKTEDATDYYRQNFCPLDKEVTRDFAFEELKLHRLELDVFSFNPRAEKTYLKAGFKREGVLRDAIIYDDKYADDILMSILEDEWRALKE